MRRVACEACGTEHPMNETLSVLGSSLCEACATQRLEALGDDEAPEGSVHYQCDPTICAQCGEDNGPAEWGQVAGLPMCSVCEQAARRRPFPAWVKVALLCVVALAAVELQRNWRLFQAYSEISRQNRACERGDLAEGYRLLASAAKHVPERPMLEVQAVFLRAMVELQEGRREAGCDSLREAARLSRPLGGTEQIELYLDRVEIELLIADDKHEEALRRIDAFERRFNEKQWAWDLRNLALISQAFAAKDYDRYVELAEKRRQRAPDRLHSLLMMASALACKYAASGDKAFEERTRSHLDAARARVKTDAEREAFRDTAERVEHRLRTREIIDKKEYDRRFRNGRQKEGSP